MKTLPNLIQHPGKDISTSLVPDSHVNRTVLPEIEELPKESPTPGTSGPKHERSFGWWDQSGSCLRTYQASFLEMMEGKALGSVYLESFPNWGLMLDGEFIARPMQEPRTSESGGGSWPTPTPTPRNERESLEEWEGRREREKALGRNGNGFGMPLDVAVRYDPNPKISHIPTPTTADVYTGNMKSTQQSDGSMHSVSLPDYVEMFPTPSTMDHIERKGMRPSRAATNRTTGYLSEEVTRWATPTGEDANNVTCASGDFQSLSREVEGSLNPDWVEQHLMSLPEGWTRLKPLPDGAYDEWFDAMKDGTWWDTERGLPRVTTGAKNRVNRLKMLGNGIVPATLALFLEAESYEDNS